MFTRNSTPDVTPLEPLKPGQGSACTGIIRWVSPTRPIADDDWSLHPVSRFAGEGGAFEREPDIELPDAIPELRERSDEHGTP